MGERIVLFGRKEKKIAIDIIKELNIVSRISWDYSFKNGLCYVMFIYHSNPYVLLMAKKKINDEIDKKSRTGYRPIETLKK
jgi:hypothetical protein